MCFSKKSKPSSLTLAKAREGLDSNHPSAAHRSAAWLGSGGTLMVRCKTCGKRYRLGKDAVVTTAASVHGIFGRNHQTMFDSLDSKEHPDLITEAEWDRVNDQNTIINDISLIKQSLGSGEIRWWKCRGCGTVQQY